jgi:hypothetical protein
MTLRMMGEWCSWALSEALMPCLRKVDPGTVVEMKSSLLPLFAGLLVLACPTLAQADDASKAVKIEEMLALTHADRIVAQMQAQMQPLMADTIKKMNLPDDAQPMAEEMQKSLTEWISSKLSWERMKPLYVKIYADTLTEEEISGAIEFYKTPAGQSLLNKMPMILQKSIAASQEILTDMVPEIQKITDDVARKYKKP